MEKLINFRTGRGSYIFMNEFELQIIGLYHRNKRSFLCIPAWFRIN